MQGAPTLKKKKNYSFTRIFFFPNQPHPNICSNMDVGGMTSSEKKKKKLNQKSNSVNLICFLKLQVLVRA